MLWQINFSMQRRLGAALSKYIWLVCFSPIHSLVKSLEFSILFYWVILRVFVMNLILNHLIQQFTWLNTYIRFNPFLKCHLCFLNDFVNFLLLMFSGTWGTFLYFLFRWKYNCCLCSSIPFCFDCQVFH